LPDSFIFKPKIPIWVNLGGPWNGKRGYGQLYFLGRFCILNGHLVNVLVVWYIYQSFGKLCQENLATLRGTHKEKIW
jgi:hypothetical protein